MKLPTPDTIDISEKKVLLRADLDIEEDEKIRLKSLFKTLGYLAENKAKITIIGHKGRPGGKKDEGLSLKPIEEILKKMCNEEFGTDFWEDTKIEVLENLRFNKGEEGNDQSYAKSLAEGKDVYINEAFASSHRKHASIVSLPKLLTSAAGFHFKEEIKNLDKVRTSPQKPVIFILGGKKEDKLSFLKDIKKIADLIMVGGRLPVYLGDYFEEEGVFVSKLIADKEDLTIHAIEVIEEEVSKAGTIFLSGPMGRYEEEGHMLGTKRVFEAIAESPAYKVAGGGDTETAIQRLNLTNKFDWISVGGGASLTYVAKGALPGIEALLN